MVRGNINLRYQVIQNNRTGKEKWNRLIKGRNCTISGIRIIFGEMAPSHRHYDGGYVIAGINRRPMVTKMDGLAFETDPETRVGAGY